MQSLIDFFRQLYDPEGLAALINWGGYAVIAAIVFSETGLLAGFFLPGDSLLFTAGMLVGTDVLKPPPFLPQDRVSAIVILNLLLMAAAFVGNSTGYWVGTRAGPRLFNRPDSRFFKREHLVKTREFYEKHGAKTIILAEFMPFARTFAPVVAGITAMPYRLFMTFNAIGVVIWIGSMTILGYTLGRAIPDLGKHIDKAIIVIVVLSIIPALVHIARSRARSHGKR